MAVGTRVSEDEKVCVFVCQRANVGVDRNADKLFLEHKERKNSVSQICDEPENRTPQHPRQRSAHGRNWSILTSFSDNDFSTVIQSIGN